jgi:hypothetical protein
VIAKDLGSASRVCGAGWRKNLFQKKIGVSAVDGGQSSGLPVSVTADLVPDALGPDRAAAVGEWYLAC